MYLSSSMKKLILLLFSFILTLSVLAQSYFDKGVSLYEEAKYEEALDYFEIGRASCRERV